MFTLIEISPHLSVSSLWNEAHFGQIESCGIPLAKMWPRIGIKGMPSFPDCFQLREPAIRSKKRDKRFSSFISKTTSARLLSSHGAESSPCGRNSWNSLGRSDGCCNAVYKRMNRLLCSKISNLNCILSCCFSIHCNVLSIVLGGMHFPYTNGSKNRIHFFPSHPFQNQCSPIYRVCSLEEWSVMTSPFL